MTMNVLLVTGHIRDADFIEHELRKTAPHIHIVISPTCDDALARAASSERADAVLLDLLPTGGEDLRLIERLRDLDPPPAIIVMSGPADPDPPLGALKAGADDYIVKRPNFVRSLPG